MLMRLVKELHLPRSYNLNYMCIGNPQLLELHIERFTVPELFVLGLQALGCTQLLGWGLQTNNSGRLFCSWFLIWSAPQAFF